MPLRNKKTLAVLAAACLLFGLVGCKADAGQDKAQKTVEPPESGWTHEQISEVTYLCGEPFSLPCKLEDLPDDFEISKLVPQDNAYITVSGQDKDCYNAWLQVDGDYVGLAHYYEDGMDKIVFSIDFPQDLYGRDILVINGVNQNSLFSEVEQALGKFVPVDYDIPCFYDHTIINSEYPGEHIRVMIINDYEDEEMGIIDEEGIIGFSYSLFEVKHKK